MILFASTMCISFNRHVANPLGTGRLRVRCTASMLSINCVIAKDIKSCTSCCYVRCATLIELLGRNDLAPNRRNYHNIKFSSIRNMYSYSFILNLKVRRKKFWSKFLVVHLSVRNEVLGISCICIYLVS